MNRYGGTERWVKDFLKVNFNEFNDVGIAKLKSENENDMSFIEKFIMNPNVRLINLNNVGQWAISNTLKGIFGEKLYMYFIYQTFLYLGNFNIRKKFYKYDVAYLTNYKMIIPIKLLNPRLKIVYGTHNNDFSKLKGRNKYSFGYIYAKISLALTEMVHFVAENSSKNIKFTKKISSVSNGIDTLNFFPSNELKKNQKIKILFVGRLEEYKGVKIALDAVMMLPENTYSLTICGDGALKDYVVSNKPPDSIFIPNVSDEILRQIYRENDILIFPSLVETFGLVVLEALASGLYCIVSETLRPKFEEFLDMNVLSFSKRDKNSFAEAILDASSKLLTHQKKREVFNHINKKYSIYALYPDLANQILELC
jgi:glycosyltransferase involved in cell wall biosynthesis